MIRYALLCAAEHGFDGWFRSSDDFEAQNREGLVACPVCGTAEVRKALMAPAVRTKRSPAPTPPPTPSAAPPQAAGAAGTQGSALAALEGPNGQRLRGLLREFHAKLRQHAENVGPRFPEEARRIHEGDAKARPIYGSASGDEARALVEEGIEVMPLPPLPDDHH